MHFDDIVGAPIGVQHRHFLIGFVITDENHRMRVSATSAVAEDVACLRKAE
jgi:hypothetical protein